MKIEKFKVLLYLKKSGLDKNGKAPIMGRITLNRTMAQFGCKLSVWTIYTFVFSLVTKLPVPFPFTYWLVA